MIETEDRRAVEYLAAKSTHRPMLFYILKCICVLQRNQIGRIKRLTEMILKNDL